MAKSLDNITTHDFMDPFNIAQLADDITFSSETSESLKYSKKRYLVPNIKKTLYCNINDSPDIEPMFIDNNDMIQSVDSTKDQK